MKGAQKILPIVAVVFLTGAVHAQTVSWNYAEGGWGTVDPDGGSREDGWFVGGSGALGKVPIHIFGEYSDFGQLEIWQAGAGWHGLLGERADLFADGAFYDTDVDNGFRIRFGVRWMVTKRFELNGNLAWTDLDLSDNASAAVNVIFDVTKRFGVGGGIEWGDEFSTGRVFARFNFGKKN
jgi:hypothetical protein